MASFRVVIIAGAVAIGAVNAAHAADLDLPPPPPVEAPPPPVVGGGWYLRGDVGYGFDQLSSVRSNLASTTPGFADTGAGIDGQASFGGGVGYQVNNWFRADVTAEYRTPTHYSNVESFNDGGGVFGGDAYNASIQSEDILANAYFDVGTWYGFTPFVGGGIGVAFHQFHGLTDRGFGPFSTPTSFGAAPDVGMARLAWAAMAGIDYNISPNWKFEVSYRYLDMGTLTSGGIVCDGGCGTPETQSFHLTANEVRVGLRYIFADVPAPPPPLVTKY